MNRFQEELIKLKGKEIRTASMKKRLFFLFILIGLISMIPSLVISSSAEEAPETISETDIVDIISTAGQFPMHYIFKNFKEFMDETLVASPEHPVKIFFKHDEGIGDPLPKEILNSHSVSATIDINVKYEGKVTNSSSDDANKNEVDGWVKLVDPELHITSGGFTIKGIIKVDGHKVVFIEGELFTDATTQQARFSDGTRCKVDNVNYLFRDGTWKKHTISNK